MLHSTDEIPPVIRVSRFVLLPERSWADKSDKGICSAGSRLHGSKDEH